MLTRRDHGFTLVELMITVTLVALLLMEAVPAFQTWVVDAKVRSTAEALQNALRMTEVEAVRRSHQVTLVLTATAAPPGGTAAVHPGGSAAGWYLQQLPLSVADCNPASSCFISTSPGNVSGTTITGPAAVCFNSIGQMVANTSASVPAACAVATSTYDITAPGTSRPLRVIANFAGQVRMCDPAKALSASTPDGC